MSKILITFVISKLNLINLVNNMAILECTGKTKNMHIMIKINYMLVGLQYESKKKVYEEA